MKFETLRLSGIWLLIAGVLVALFAGWIQVGPLFWFVFAVILIGAAVLWVNRINPTSMLDGLAKLAGYSTTSLGALAILIFGIPLLIRITPAYVSAQWEPIVSTIQNQGSTELASASDTLRSFFASTGAATFGNTSTYSGPDNTGGSQSQSANGDTYIVKSGDTFNQIADERGMDREELRRLNPGINYDQIEAGQEINVGVSDDEPEPITAADTSNLPEEPSTAEVVNPTDESSDTVTLGATQPVVVEPTVLPTPTLAPVPTIPSFAAEMITVKELKLDGKRYEALFIVDAILRKYPTHPEALIYKSEIERADELILLWAGLTHSGKGQHERVKAALSGYEFEIIESKNILIKSLWEEESRIISIQPGWTYGYTLRLKRAPNDN